MNKRRQWLVAMAAVLVAAVVAFVCVAAPLSARAEDDDETTTQTVVYALTSSDAVTDSLGNKILVLTEGASDTTYYVEDGSALCIKGTGTTTGSNGTSDDDPIVFENCTFVLTGYTCQINKGGVSGVGNNGESLARLAVAGNVTFENCTITFSTEDYTDGGSSTTAGYDCALYLFTGNITFDDCTITGTDWYGQGIGTFESANVTFNSCEVTTTGNMGAWSYAMYQYSYWTMNDSTLMATGELRKSGGSNINCFYSGDLRTNYDALTFTNTYVEFTDNQAGGFAINNINIHVTNSTIIVSNNLGNAANSGYWIVSNSTIEMNGNRGGHGLSCIGFEMTGSTLEILHNGYAGVYIQSKASSLTDCTVDIRCNGENLLSYTAGDTWLANHTLTITNCTSNALEGSAWLGAVGRKGSVVTTDGSSVVAYDLNTNAVDNLKSSTTASLTSTTVSLSDTNNVDISDLTNGIDYVSLLGEDEHILLLNPWMTSDYARGNGEDTSSDNDADLFDDDNNLSGDYASDYILNYQTAKIGTLTTAQLSHHIYDFDTVVETVEATSTTYGYAAYACVDVCAEYEDNTDEHTYSYDCDGTYVYAPLVGLHFEANAYDDDGNDVSDTVEGMPDDQATITFSGTAETVSDPTREGYVFAGWYLDEDCTEEFDFSTNLNACWTVVYAKWVKATTVTVTKTWDDSDDADGIRPDSVTVELYADGVATGLTLTLSDENDWTAAFTGIAAYTDDDETTAVSYTVVETSVAGYETSYSEVTGSASDGWSVEVTNSLVTVDVTVSKVWDDSDDEDGIRPDSVTVALYADGEDTGKFVELSEENGWTATFEDLAAYAYDDDGNLYEVTYTVEEVAVNGYAAELTGVTFSLGSLSVEITNTHEVTTTSVTVTKAWDDDDDADELRPESVTVSLYADGEGTGLTVTLSEENGWTATFEGLAAYTYDDDGNATEVAYAIAEVDVPDGYEVTYSAFSGSVEEGYSITVTNTHEVAMEEPEDEAEDEDEVTAEEESEEETTTEEETSEVPDTGDATTMTWAAPAVAGLAAVAGALVLRRRARR